MDPLGPTWTHCDRGFGGKDKKLFGKPEPAVYATEDGGHETVKAAAVLNLGVVIFPAIVHVSASLVAPTSPVKSSGTRVSARCLQFVLSFFFKIYHFN